jgi:hypothetical protein
VLLGLYSSTKITNFVKSCTFSPNRFDMLSFQVDLLNPEAEKLLEELARLNLIRIRPTLEPKVVFQQLLERIRARAVEFTPLSEEEIAKEVDLVRTKHHRKHAKN